MERRDRGSGRVESVSCPACGQDMPIDSTQLRRAGAAVLMRCAGCGADRSMRLTDVDRPPPERPVEAEPASTRRRGWRRQRPEKAAG